MSVRAGEAPIAHRARSAFRQSLSQAALRQRRCRRLQSEVHRERVRAAHRSQQRQSRHDRMAGPQLTSDALTLREAPLFHLGPMNQRCASCRASHFQAEVNLNHPNLFTDCCDLGRVSISLIDDFPQILSALLRQRTTDDIDCVSRQNNFHENIRNFNSALAMASVGAQVVPPGRRGPFCYRIHDQIYHRIGALHPEPGKARRFGQIYMLDTELATDVRLQRNRQCHPDTMRILSSLLMSVNPFAKAFKMMNEVEAAEQQLALQEERPLPTLTMVFEKTHLTGLKGRPYDLPTANEVAIVYVAENEDVLARRSLVVHQRGARSLKYPFSTIDATRSRTPYSSRRVEQASILNS